MQKNISEDSVVQDKVAGMLKDTVFFNYLVEEAFREADKEGNGFLTPEQIRDTLSEVSQELKMPKLGAKELDRIVGMLLEGSEETNLTLEQFKAVVASVLNQPYDNALPIK